jgi:hypothetical protein
MCCIFEFHFTIQAAHKVALDILFTVAILYCKIALEGGGMTLKARFKMLRFSDIL